MCVRADLLASQTVVIGVGARGGARGGVSTYLHCGTQQLGTVCVCLFALYEAWRGGVVRVSAAHVNKESSGKGECAHSQER